MRALLTVAVYITPFLLIGVAAKIWIKRKGSSYLTFRPKATRTVRGELGSSWGSGATRAAIKLKHYPTPVDRGRQRRDQRAGLARGLPGRGAPQRGKCGRRRPQRFALISPNQGASPFRCY